MIKEENDKTQCLNCGESLPQDAAFCPSCGQSTKVKTINLFDLIREFFSNFVVFDLKIFRSLKALLLPGKITVDFFAGKHSRYTSPWRLFFISIVAMLILGNIDSKIQTELKPNVESEDDGSIYIDLKKGWNMGSPNIDSIQQEYVDSIKNIIDSIKGKPKFDSILHIVSKDSILPKSIIKNIKNEWITKHQFELNTIKNKIANADYPKLQKIYYALDLARTCEDTIIKKIVDSTALTFNNQLNDTYLDSFQLFKKQISKYDINTLSLNQIKAKYKIKDEGFMKNTLNKIVYKFNSQNSTFDMVKDYILKNINWYIIFLLPFVALIFKILYIRRKRYFVEHLVFNLHVHSAIFLLFALYTIISWNDNEQIQNISGFVLAFAPMVYYIVAMKRYYRQSWGKTVTKLLIFSFIYAILIFITAVIYVGVAAVMI